MIPGVVWVMAYIELVPVGLDEPPWRYPAEELVIDLSYHLVYGAATATGYHPAHDGGAARVRADRNGPWSAVSRVQRVSAPSGSCSRLGR